MLEDDPILTFADLRRVYCAEGTRQRFEWSKTGIDLRDFARYGVRASVLREFFNDALIDRVVDAKRSAQET